MTYRLRRHFNANIDLIKGATHERLVNELAYSNLSKNEGIVANRRHDKVIVPQNYIDSYKLIIKNV